FKSKKYIVPSAVASPIFAGCVFAVYLGSGAGRFEPARDALVFDPDSDSAPSGQKIDRAWSKLQSKATVDFDDDGRPVLEMEIDGRIVRVGATAGNVLNGNAPP